MAVNKVVYGNDTLIDLTGDTVTAANLASGVTAHDRAGAQITGTGSGGIAVKELTYTGTGTTTNAITFPEKPTLILSIQFTNKPGSNAGILPCRYGNSSIFCVWGSYPGSWNGSYSSALTYSADELTMTIHGSDKGSAWNDETTDYVVYYI